MCCWLVVACFFAVVRSLMMVARCLLFSVGVRCPLFVFVAYCLMCVVCCFLCFEYGLWFVAWSLFVVCCLLIVAVCCLLLVVCGLLLVVSCACALLFPG